MRRPTARQPSPLADPPEIAAGAHVDDEERWLVLRAQAGERAAGPPQHAARAAGLEALRK